MVEIKELMPEPTYEDNIDVQLSEAELIEMVKQRSTADFVCDMYTDSATAADSMYEDAFETYQAKNRPPTPFMYSTNDYARYDSSDEETDLADIKAKIIRMQNLQAIDSKMLIDMFALCKQLFEQITNLTEEVKLLRAYAQVRE